MSLFEIRVGDVFEQLALIPDDSVDCCVTSPPYWGLRDYGFDGQIGLEPTLAEHLAVMVRVFDEIRRVLKPMGCCWLNYGDTYATKPNGRSAAAIKAAGKDDRSFQDKPFSTIGPINPLAFYDADYAPGARGRYAADFGTKRPITRTEHTGRVVAGPNFEPIGEKRRATRGPKNRRLHDGRVKGGEPSPGQIHAGGYLKEKDLCMIPNRLAIALQDAGWWVRSEIVWGKPNPMPDSSGKYRPSTAHEKVWLLTKSARSFYDQMAVRMPASGGANARVSQAIMNHATQSAHLFGDEEISSMKPRTRPPGVSPKSVEAGARVRNNEDFAEHTSRAIYEDRFLRNYEPDLSPIVPPQVWEIPTASFAEAHFATFPPALVVPCLLSSCPVGGTVLDPFGGSGTVALVAQKLARNSILIEGKPEYAEMARRRVMAGDIGLPEVAA